MATRQTSSSGRPKSPRIQVVLPEDLCRRLADLAEHEARTVSNMARVLIQQGVDRLERERPSPGTPSAHAAAHAAANPAASATANAAAHAAAADAAAAERFRQQLERQRTRRLRTAPRRLRLQRPD